MSQPCLICGSNGAHPGYRCREQMFGLGDGFDYFQCHHCQCLQISQPPVDWKRYYPPHYYSFSAPVVPQTGLKAWFAARRDRSVASESELTGAILDRLQPARDDLRSLGRIGLKPEARLLDVGCGTGQLLSVLHRAGFHRLAGIDPFLERDVEVLPAVTVRKCRIEEVDERFDCVMLHHVFEHVLQPLETLIACRDRLSEGGRILLRLPWVEGEAWETYREHWVQLDAPRHQFLHSRASLERLARQAGLSIQQIWCDSTAFQFWGSELYRRGIPLVNSEGQMARPEDHFSSAQLKVFAARARELNAMLRGDQVVVLLGPQSL
jgi:SAM-dependent methyltransferase